VWRLEWRLPDFGRRGASGDFTAACDSQIRRWLRGVDRPRCEVAQRLVGSPVVVAVEPLAQTFLKVVDSGMLEEVDLLVYDSRPEASLDCCLLVRSLAAETPSLLDQTDRV
jgi:hypothetical protein